MKRLPLPGESNRNRTYVRERGGQGWEGKAKTQRMLGVFFLSAGQGDVILIQTPDERRI